jgi:hypothetical protein
MCGRVAYARGRLAVYFDSHGALLYHIGRRAGTHALIAECRGRLSAYEDSGRTGRHNRSAYMRSAVYQRTSMHIADTGCRFTHDVVFYLNKCLKINST